jgi:hypothetical protein
VTRINGNTPVVLVVAVLGVMATLIGVQSQEVREQSRRISALECAQAEVQTDVKYIKAAIDRMEAQP